MLRGRGSEQSRLVLSVGDTPGDTLPGGGGGGGCSEATGIFASKVGLQFRGLLMSIFIIYLFIY